MSDYSQYKLNRFHQILLFILYKNVLSILKPTFIVSFGSHMVWHAYKVHKILNQFRDNISQHQHVGVILSYT